MKNILIDDLLEDDSVSEITSITIDGKVFEGWQIAKPLNYEKKYTGFIDRLRASAKVLMGKAIAVQYFSDLTEQEKIDHVKLKIKH